VLARLARLRPLGRRLERLIDRRWPGPRPSAVARTRLIDDLVVDAVAGGARQVLLLGAGYDSRAFRLPALARVPVFEADHPATQRVKQRLLRGAVRPERRAHVHFVPVDLLHDDLGAALRAAGFARLEPTVIVWEGVTNYLTAPAVDATLRLLADATATGSRLVLTYVDRRMLDHPASFPDAVAWHDAVARQGEPWTFGFDPAELPGYLAARGLRLATDLSTRDAARRYLPGRGERAAAFYRVAEAEIR
jgi:methyltransferase (TIGR00027 family)